MVDGVRPMLLEVLGRLACRVRGVDADEVSSITGEPAWEFMAWHEIQTLRLERSSRQRLENIA